MKIGMMNNPILPVEQEIMWAAEHDFDFIDMTMEPPGALIRDTAVEALRGRLEAASLEVVGHTAWYLPLDCPFRKVQDTVISLMTEQINRFYHLGAEKITVHLIFSLPHRFFSFRQKLDLWRAALEPLVHEATRLGPKIMLENTGNSEEDMRLMDKLLSMFENLMFHLDVGHTNLSSERNRTPDYLQRFGTRLHHIHLSDNFGGTQDLHLPLGAGNISWKRILTAIRNSGYDDTFTLEVFSPDRRYLLLSRDILRQIWNNAGGEKEEGKAAI